MGYGAKYDAIYRWLDCELGHRNYVWTSDNQPGQDASSVYLCDLEAARKLVHEFGLDLLYLEDYKLV